MTQKERLLKALKREEVDRPPAAVPTQNAITEIMGKSGFRWPAAQRKAKDMAGLAWACHEIGGIESVRVPFDINVEAEAMGCETRFGNDMATPPTSRVKTRAQYNTIRVPDPRRDGRMPEVIEAVSRLNERVGDEVAVIAAMGTPFELLATSLSFEDISMAFIEEPEFVREQLEVMTGIAISYAREIEAAGADAIFLADGTSQALGPRYYDGFSFPYTKKLIQKLTRPSILHICADPTPMLRSMVETGADALSLDKPVDVPHAREVTEGKVALIGQIPPQTLLSGTREDIREEAEQAIRLGMEIIAPGCGILPQTSLENLRAFVDSVKNTEVRVPGSD